MRRSTGFALVIVLLMGACRFFAQEPAFPMESATETPSPVFLPTVMSGYVTRSDGARRLTNPPPGASDQNPAFSPDGRFLIPAEGGTPIRVTFNDSNEDGAPSWSPDGRFIAFESHLGEDENAPSSLWLVVVPPLP